MKFEKFSPDQLRRIEQLRQLAKEKNAVILAHYYTRPEIQEAADFTGDSLALSEKAAQTDADIILFAGVHFMAETAKILSPDKKVLLPDHTVVSYVNTSVGVKALTDICCTSSNAVEIVRSLPVNAKIVFAPDRNLGNYIQSVTGRDMVVWDGACHVHEEFSLEKIIELKKQYPEAKVLAHPECKKPVLLVADYVGSTAALLNYATQSDADTFIVVTEPGILHQMAKDNPSKRFIPAPPSDSTCGCNDCSYMKLVTLDKMYAALRDETPEVVIEESIRRRAERSIRNMLAAKR